jgi:nucleoid DNA-binding protein
MVTNKTEIAKRIASREVCSMSEATLQVEMVMKTIIDALKANEKVRIAGLGMFYPKHYEEHVGYDPFSKKKMVVPSYRTVTFRIAKDFMRELNEKK